MAVPAAAAADIAAKAVEKGKEALDDLAADPLLYIGKQCRKWGTVLVLGGVACYVVAQAGQRAEQYLLSDIDNRLGIANQTIPNSPPPPPPAPSEYQLDMATIASNLTSLSVVSATAAATNIWNALQAGYDLQTTLIADAAPSAAQGDCSAAVYSLEQALDALGYVPPGYGAYAQAQVASLTPQIAVDAETLAQWEVEGVGSLLIAGLQAELNGLVAANEEWQTVVSNYNTQSSGGGFTANWPSASSNMAIAIGSFNALCLDMGGVQIFPTQQVSTASSASTTSNSSPWQNAVLTVGNTALSDFESVAVGGAAGIFINTIWPGSFTQGVSQSAGYAQQAISGATGLIGDIENAFKILGNAIINLPILIADGVGYVFTMAVTTIAADLWSPMLWFGIGLVAFSFFALDIWPRIKDRLALKVRALSATAWSKIDAALRTRENLAKVEESQILEGTIERVLAEPVPEPTVVTEADVKAEEAKPEPPDPLEPTPDEVSSMEVARRESLPEPTREYVETRHHSGPDGDHAEVVKGIESEPVAIDGPAAPRESAPEPPNPEPEPAAAEEPPITPEEPEEAPDPTLDEEMAYLQDLAAVE